MRPQPRQRTAASNRVAETGAACIALMFLTGGVTTLLCAVAPRPASMNGPVLYSIGAGALLVAAVVWAFRRRMPNVAQQVLLSLGTALIVTLMATSGSPSIAVSFSLYFTWIVFYCLLFLSRPQAIAQLTFSSVGYLVGWLLAHEQSAAGPSAAEPLILFTVLGTFGVVVRMLSQARTASEIDPLTRVYNRRGMDRLINLAVTRAVDDGEGLVLALVDVDHFKLVNDRRGHIAGDQVLQDLTVAWRKSLRDSDFLCRMGGDEFLVVLPGCAQPEANEILARLREDRRVGVTCSIGATAWRPGESVSTLFMRADRALYRAKEQGRDRLAWSLHEVEGTVPQGAA